MLPSPLLGRQTDAREGNEGRSSRAPVGEGHLITGPLLITYDHEPRPPHQEPNIHAVSYTFWNRAVFSFSNDVVLGVAPPDDGQCEQTGADQGRGGGFRNGLEVERDRARQLTVKCHRRVPEALG